MSPQRPACFRSALWIGSFIVCFGMMSELARGQSENRDSSDDSRERLVLLKSGRMLTGQVIRNAGGYLIEQAGGHVQIPVEEVKCIVKDLREAYYKQRDSIVEPTPATHLALAHWCISYRLYDEAGDELKKCLKSDPENEEARRLLQRLTDTIRATLPAQIVDPTPRKTAEGFLQHDVESLGGLSPEMAAQFTSRIQPLLLNKCGNARCHGTASSNKFQIVPSRVSGHGTRQGSERNLAEILRYIDTDNVAKSRLLSALQGAHGGKGTIFVGHSGTDQIKTLRTWVRTVAQEKRIEAEEIEQMARFAPKSKSKRRVVQASAKSEPLDKEVDAAISNASFSQEVDDVATASDDESPQPKELRPDPTDAKALALEADDPFDPEQFNKRSRRR